MKRHRWTNARKSYGYTAHDCSACGITRMQRHAGGHHWTEWWRDGKPVAGADDPRPECLNQGGV